MSDARIDVELLRVVWDVSGCPGAEFESDGGRVEVLRPGVYDPQTGGYAGAEVSVAGAVSRGDVLFSARGVVAGDREAAVLHVAAGRAPVVCDAAGEPVPRITLPLPSAVVEAYGRMKERSGSGVCGPVLAAYEPVRRVSLFTRLLVDRLGRKAAEIDGIYDSSGCDWNQVLYALLLRTMGGPNNKEVFGALASRVRYSALARESGDTVAVEAMLLGASGLLGLYGDDTYTYRLKTEFDHLSRKYSIVPMSAAVWNMGRTNPRSHPVLRLAQLAAQLCAGGFSFGSVLACRGVSDLHRLFAAEASDYWTTHFIPDSITSPAPKRIGVEKAELFGINMVAPLLFAYGRHMGDEAMGERAVELLENIFCEENSIVRRWRVQGVEMKNAFDTQAILQLNNEYCAAHRCGMCPVGRNVIKGCLR